MRLSLRLIILNKLQSLNLGHPLSIASLKRAYLVASARLIELYSFERTSGVTLKKSHEKTVEVDLQFRRWRYWVVFNYLFIDEYRGQYFLVKLYALFGHKIVLIWFRNCFGL